MAAFVCEVVLDLAQYVRAELHFANYFPVAEFSACRSSLTPRTEARQQVLSQPYSGRKIAPGPLVDCRRRRSSVGQSHSKGEGLEEKAGPSSPISEREG